MTLPYERSRAVISTREFLCKISSPYNGGYKKVPTEVRQMARMLLRHYPHAYELHEAAKAAPDIFDAQAGYDLPYDSDNPAPEKSASPRP